MTWKGFSWFFHQHLGGSGIPTSARLDEPARLYATQDLLTAQPSMPSPRLEEPVVLIATTANVPGHGLNHGIMVHHELRHELHHGFKNGKCTAVPAEKSGEDG